MELGTKIIQVFSAFLGYLRLTLAIYLGSSARRRTLEVNINVIVNRHKMYFYYSRLFTSVVPYQYLQGLNSYCRPALHWHMNIYFNAIVCKIVSLATTSELNPLWGLNEYGIMSNFVQFRHLIRTLYFLKRTHVKNFSHSAFASPQVV